MRKSIVIGIGGASGSGKTYAANSIVERLEANTAVIIQEDSYYRDQAEMPYDERARRNYDHPDAFEHDLLIKQ